MPKETMKKLILSSALTLFTYSLLAADPSAKEDVIAAAKKLAEKENYGWRTTVVVPESSQFKPGPTEGKTEKGGLTHVVMSFGERKSQMIVKGDKGAMTNQEDEWQSVEELEKAEGPGRFMAGFIRNFQVPAAHAIELANDTKELKKEGDVYQGDLTEAGAKKILTFRRRGADGPKVTDPKGEVKFWLKDGLLSKFEFKVKGTMNFNGNDIAMDRATTVEVKDVGTTKLDVPEEARKKLQ
jgi:hypothetical protein